MDQFGPLRCPACDYDLHGLPVPYRCPECGTQYDICRTHWRPTISAIDPGWSMRKLMLYCLIAIALSIFAPGVSAAVAVLAAALLCGVLGLFWCRIQREHVSFDRSGVIVRTVFRETRVPWWRVSHAQSDLASWNLHLVHPADRVVLPPILADKEIERDFHQALAAARNRWANEARLNATAEVTRRELVGPLTELEKCPLCDRELRGLPAVYACPGCGFAYDPSTRLWKPAHRSLWLPVGAALAAVSVLPIMMVVKCARDEYIGRDADSALVFIPLAILAATIWIVTIRSRSRFVAIKADGIHARTAFGERFVPWSDIASASRDGSTVILRSHRNRELLRLHGVFFNESAAEQFRRAICLESEPDHGRSP